MRDDQLLENCLIQRNVWEKGKVEARSSPYVMDLKEP